MKRTCNDSLLNVKCGKRNPRVEPLGRTNRYFWRKLAAQQLPGVLCAAFRPAGDHTLQSSSGWRTSAARTTSDQVPISDMSEEGRAQARTPERPSWPYVA